MKQYKVNGQKMIVTCNGQQLEVEVVTSKIIRIFCKLNFAESDSKAIEGKKILETFFDITQENDDLWIRTEDVGVRITKDLCVDFFDKNGAIVCEDYRGSRKSLRAISEERRKLLESEGHVVRESEKHAFDVIKKMQGEGRDIICTKSKKPRKIKGF